MVILKIESLKIFSLIALLLLFPSAWTAPPAPEETPEPLSELIDAPNGRQLIFDNELDNVIAPFTYHSSLLLLAGGVLSYLTYSRHYNDQREQNWAREGNRSKPWREVGDFLGWGALPISYGLIQYGSTTWGENRHALTNTEYVGKSVVYSALATFALKNLVRQGRPKDKYKNDSFPSGHASSSFSFSTAVWLLHGPGWGIFSTALATWVTYSRIDDGSHYYHDSIAGATLGAAYAIGIYNNHFHRRLPFLFTLTPINNLGGLKASIAFGF